MLVVVAEPVSEVVEVTQIVIPSKFTEATPSHPVLVSLDVVVVDVSVPVPLVGLVIVVIVDPVSVVVVVGLSLDVVVGRRHTESPSKLTETAPSQLVVVAVDTPESVVVSGGDVVVVAPVPVPEVGGGVETLESVLVV